MPEFLLWTVLYLTIGFAYSLYAVNDAKKVARRRGEYRSDHPWHVAAGLAMLFWPVGVFFDVVIWLRWNIIEHVIAEIKGPRKYVEDVQGYSRELSTHDKLTDDVYDLMNWREVEIDNKCGYGCKIYEHNKTGERVLAHNSAYGCRK